MKIHFQFHFFATWSIPASILPIVTWKAPASSWSPSELAMFFNIDPRCFGPFGKISSYQRDFYVDGPCFQTMTMIILKQPLEVPVGNTFLCDFALTSKTVICGKVHFRVTIMKQWKSKGYWMFEFKYCATSGLFLTGRSCFIKIVTFSPFSYFD